MKTVLIAALCVAASVSLWAKERQYQACTADHQVVTLAVELAEATSADVEKAIGVAFVETAKALQAGRLQDQEGFELFVSKLTTEAAAAIEDLHMPVVGPNRSCS